MAVLPMYIENVTVFLVVYFMAADLLSGIDSI